MAETLEQLIRRSLHLPSHYPQGRWIPILCKVCNDKGHKGKRAGFKFDGHTVGYNCFNCSHKAVYDPSTDPQFVSKEMQAVFKAFSIEEIDWKASIFHHSGVTVFTKTNKPVNPVVELELPSYFYKLTDANSNDEWADYARYYLETERAVDPASYSFYLAFNDGTSQSKQWVGRLIIPVFVDGKIVYYQGRDLSGERKQKYLDPIPSVPRDNILGGYDNIADGSFDQPLYVTEGWFNSFHIKGVSCFGPKMLPGQIAILQQTARPKVIVPDRTGDGYRLAKQALSLGWSVATPDIGSCTDINSAVTKYGVLYVSKSIHDHTYSGFMGETRLNLYCENTTTGAKSNKTSFTK